MTRESVGTYNGLLRRLRGGAALLAAVTLLTACHQDMWNQPRLEPLEPTEFFADGRGSRDLVEGTVPYAGKRREWRDPVFTDLTGVRDTPPVTDVAFWTGKTPDGFVEENYFEISRALIERGKERFDINCMPCHGLVGDGRGVVAFRGFQGPASYHSERLRQVEDGYIFDVITNGFGRMFSYAARVAPEDRWAIAAYIRALQASQDVDITNPDAPLTQEVLAGIEQQEEAMQQQVLESHGAHGESDDHNAH